MRFSGAKKVHYDSGPNMTPLVDVVMVILIFLMLCGTFAGAEHYLTTDIPFSKKGVGHEPLPKGFVPDEPLEVRVDCPTPDRFVARAGQIQVSDPASLTAQLNQMRQRFNQSGTPTDKIQVQISPGRNVKYKFLIDVYEAALNANFTKVG